MGLKWGEASWQLRSAHSWLDRKLIVQLRSYFFPVLCREELPVFSPQWCHCRGNLVRAEMTVCKFRAICDFTLFYSHFLSRAVESVVKLIMCRIKRHLRQENILNDFPDWANDKRYSLFPELMKPTISLPSTLLIIKRCQLHMLSGHQAAGSGWICLCQWLWAFCLSWKLLMVGIWEYG